jgi:hypothetical protein
VLITEKFVFVHLPKTGGSFIRQASEGMEVLTLEPHAGVDDIPPRFAGLPVFAVIRNPWDWYVSWFHFVLQTGQQNVDWEQLGGSDFAATVRAACGDSQSPLGRDLARDDRDYYSAMWWKLFGRDGRVTVGRFERLADDFRSFCDRLGVQIDVSGPAVNESQRNPYREYYTPELRDLVKHKARHLIRTYGYEF